ncbi:MAG: L,D-transpeptidase [Mariprofundales bacterium]|nr:L,D-transpeptidase [Mariprofundales bacterium]
MIRVDIAGQYLAHRFYGVWRSYPVSTAKAGKGNLRGSLQTPIGRHHIAAKIGKGMPIRTAFRGRQPVGIYQPTRDDPTQDWILSRILWLAGEQTGQNRRGSVDTWQRYIYIHGTHDEAAIGTPSSHGCIRMRNCDIITLFDRVQPGERVIIR